MLKIEALLNIRVLPQYNVFSTNLYNVQTNTGKVVAFAPPSHRADKFVIDSSYLATENYFLMRELDSNSFL